MARALPAGNWVPRVSVGTPRLRLTGRTVQALGSAGLAWLALFGAVQLGLVVPGEERLPSLAAPGSLERVIPRPGSFGPLSPAFIERVLGLSPGSPASSGGPEGASIDGPIAAAGALTAGALAAGADKPRTVLAHAFNNDDRSNALVVESIPFTARTQTDAATRASDDPQSCSPTGSTVWYRYRATRDRVLVATTFGTDYAAGLGVFTDRSVGTLEQIGCDVDPIGAAQVVFSGRSDQTYFFQVTAPAGGGDLVFNLDPLGTTRRVSVTSDGRQVDGGGDSPSVSADGRYVAFMSTANDLVEGDNNVCPPYQRITCPDIFVHDDATGRTERVSVSSGGREGNHVSMSPGISGDGRYVGFVSLASNLVPGDTNDQWDVFVHDRLTGATERVSVDSHERQARYSTDVRSSEPNAVTPSVSLSQDGRYVAFASDFPNLVADDRNACFNLGILDFWAVVLHPEPPVHVPAELANYNCRDVFVRDRLEGTTTRVSVASDGSEAQGDSASAFITPNGRYVAFSSDAESLDPRDRNGRRDAFVHDRITEKTELVSVSSTGEQGNSNSGGINERGDTTVSADGRYVAFISFASNFAEGDLYDQDVFLRDRLTGRTVMLPGTFDEDVRDRGTVLYAEGLHASISADGRFVASSYRVKVARDGGTQEMSHVLVYDRLADRTTRVSVSSAGEEGDDASFIPDMSAEGSVVAFRSNASNLDDESDTNGDPDVFVHELPWAR